jgi:hypothetical protein
MDRALTLTPALLRSHAEPARRMFPQSSTEHRAMIRSRSTLRTLLTGATPSLALPTGAMRQLVGYYVDWRRSRDILNDPDEPHARRGATRTRELLDASGRRSLRNR